MAGLRAALRRRWRPGSAANPAANPAGNPTANAAAVIPGPTTAAGPGRKDGPAAPSDLDAHVPRLLQVTAAWSWRLLLTGLVIYLAFRLAVALRLVTLPFIAAMLGTALLQQFVAWLHHNSV